MASKQVSLCWDNFHKSMCTGMSSLLKNEDLVDVTIAVEGRYFKAHKMVLSVCSPYFRELFKVNPCKHPIVFMKDVSYVAMNDLLQFMYNGEVQVLQENLSTFRKTAEALQITGVAADENHVQRIVSENKEEVPPEIDHCISEDQEQLILVKTEPNYDPTSSTLLDDELDEDPLYDENIDDFTEDYSMLEEEESKPGTSANISFSPTCIGDDEIRQLADKAELSLVPEKSKNVYYKEYERLMEWMASKNSDIIDETLMLAYMNKMSNMSYKPSTLWCLFSKLQTMLRIKKGVDIGSFHKLRAYMKELNKGFNPKKSLVFTEEQLRKFFIEAPDECYLSLKVLVICGIFGSCRRFEMCDLRMSDIKAHDSTFIVTIRSSSKTEKSRKFAVVNDSDILYFNLFKKYLLLRPKNLNTDRVFLKYANGKCFRQVVGINTIGKCPSLVARFLNLPDATKYTGHAFRRTSVSIMANTGMCTNNKRRRKVGLKSLIVTKDINSTLNAVRVSKRLADSVASTSSTVEVKIFNENCKDEAVQSSSDKDLKESTVN